MYENKNMRCNKTTFEVSLATSGLTNIFVTREMYFEINILELKIVCLKHI